MPHRPIDDETIERIRGAFAAGMTHLEIAAIVGRTDRTIYRWFHEGEIQLTAWDDAEDKAIFEATEDPIRASYRRLYQVCYRARVLGTGLLVEKATAAAIRACDLGDPRAALRIVDMRRCNHKMADPDATTGAGVTVVFVCPERTTAEDDPGDAVVPELEAQYESEHGGNGSGSE